MLSAARLMAVITETNMSNSMSTGAATPAGFAGPAILERGYRQAAWRLIPFVFIYSLFNYLGRVDVSADAALTMPSTVLPVGAILAMLVPARFVNR
jgi:hypothetical protein